MKTKPFIPNLLQVLLLGAVLLCPAASIGEAPDSPALDLRLINPIQLERKFQDAYSIIEERYIDRVQTNSLMMKGFMAMLKVPGMEEIKYSDLIAPTQRLGTMRDDFDAFRMAIRAIRAKTGGQCDLDSLVSAMIRGMVEGLDDDYSAYLEPEKNRELQEILRGERRSYAGIGIKFEFRNERCHIVAPIPDSPAYRAGLRPGDAIVLVDGEPLKNEHDATSRISGEPGTPVVLTVEREEVPDLLNYQLVRQTIIQPELEKIMLPKEIGYVRVNSFNEHSGKALLENLRYLEGMGMKKCILDLRMNAGGLLKAAVEISDIFLPRGSLVVKTEGRAENSEKQHLTERNLPFTRIPLIVLVDGYTASAAEIVTGAIRDNRRGIAVGTTTFGKGTVQEVKQLDDNSALKLTVARYLTPSGVSIDKKGIRPDHVVKMDQGKAIFPTKYADSSSVDFFELAEDKQIKKAMELLGFEFPVFPVAASGA